MNKPELQKSCASDSPTAIAANAANGLMAIAQELEEIKEFLKPDKRGYKIENSLQTYLNTMEKK